MNSAIYTDGAIVSGFRCTSEFTSKDHALMACPTPISVCGTTKIIVANASATSTTNPTQVTLTAGNASVHCSYLVKATCGAPGFDINTSTTEEDTIVKLHYLEWDTDDAGFTKSTTYTDEEYPIETASPNVMND